MRYEITNFLNKISAPINYTILCGSSAYVANRFLKIMDPRLAAIYVVAFSIISLIGTMFMREIFWSKNADKSTKFLGSLILMTGSFLGSIAFCAKIAGISITVFQALGVTISSIPFFCLFFPVLKTASNIVDLSQKNIKKETP
jgi:hypothetical protein